MPLVIVLLSTPLAAPVMAGPGDHSHEYGFGDTPGNPLVKEDAEACLADTADDDATTCVVLYGHMFDILADVLVNTQRPPVGTRDLARGFSMTPNVEPYYDLNHLEMYSSPGFVEYQEDASLDPLVIHPERGITSDVRFARDVPVRGYWYMSADWDELSGQDPEADTGALACLTVRMVLATGRDYDPENMIAEGTSTKTIVSSSLAADQERKVLAEMPCGEDRTAEVMFPQDVTEFAVEMGLPEKDIPADKGFVVLVEWYQYAPGDPDDQDKVAGQGFNIRSGHHFPNRVVVPIENPVRIDEMRVAPFNGKLYVQAESNSPWGSYDVDPTSIRMRVIDAAGNEVALKHVETPILRYDTTHAGHFKPVTATFPWDHKAEGLAPGTYTVEVEVRNWQHTAMASKSLDIEIKPKEVIVPTETEEPLGERPVPKEAPAAVFPALLASVAVALLALRRRR
ncbi:MAG: hypothetical protein KY455_13630 [Euryarchaeota archaeon]|nr:hypothetical protein [Euryarchaeota archaeon]